MCWVSRGALHEGFVCFCHAKGSAISRGQADLSILISVVPAVFRSLPEAGESVLLGMLGASCRCSMAPSHKAKDGKCQIRHTRPERWSALDKKISRQC